MEMQDTGRQFHIAGAIVWMWAWETWGVYCLLRPREELGGAGGNPLPAFDNPV